MNKREFIKSISKAGLMSGTFMSTLDKLMASNELRSANDLSTDEDFWAKVREGYRLKPDYINLENGYYCIMPQEIMDRHIQREREVNFQGSWYMRNHRLKDNIEIRKKLAQVVGAKTEEVILTRNATESLDTIIAAYDWRPGDEAVMAIQDYGSMLDMFRLQARRYGLVNKKVDVPLHPKDDEEIVSLYEKAITPNTRLLMVSHMINITGQILPIQKICAMAHTHGVDVLVDGAHCVGHFEYSISSLDCDYYASSLHKWLSTPLGAGLLYVRQDKINNLWQMFGDTGYKDDDIRKLNHTGTPPVHTHLAVMDAIDYYNLIGPARKEARMRYLQQYWTTQVRDLPHIDLNTPEDPSRSCGIANVGVKGMKPADLAKTLLEKYKIFTVAIDGANVHGCRISPNIYTTTAELDTFIAALKEMST
ncbi:MAG: aminotransferase class V-fold PLP-dependent enzyme [Saprospiraceae bacterium]|jgi:selenocysteine lyase/cysteine desulfurase|nr:aminotransferase class V-fold PLP-dependent enzyme [Saprospiraceae bacterium]MBK6480002.1 aminotransferase class V-fold PLP-dependent enzyme [Saprospiraceae bacterium]MBK7372183.1 aminotransferase class V-fold PLP-dependent enzyme [Saprospiraceae bacterium]MBK7435359.1 aminotransferase class V-fold PLP-dependent enzyme [Saprospiraceae bacterium]MBK7607667.1 aminotransferase class V-fold PLP-dependent enzyme [Saprospiraceae bacterium]